MELLKAINFDSLGKTWPIGTLQSEIESSALQQIKLAGMKVGGEFCTQAVPATLYALGGMSIFIAFGFDWIGGAPMQALFRDTVIADSLFSIFDQAIISLTVVVALLTLVGYAMKDVVSGRTRKSLPSSLSFTPLIAASLLFGVQVLNGFSFTLLAGIIVCTYSSIVAASPSLVDLKDQQDARAVGVRADRIEMKAPFWESLKAAK